MPCRCQRKQQSDRFPTNADDDGNDGTDGDDNTDDDDDNMNVFTVAEIPRTWQRRKTVEFEQIHSATRTNTRTQHSTAQTNVIKFIWALLCRITFDLILKRDEDSERAPSWRDRAKGKSPTQHAEHTQHTSRHTHEWPHHSTYSAAAAAAVKVGTPEKV